MTTGAPLSQVGSRIGSAAVGVDWLTYGFSPLRTGENPNETTLSPTTVGSLRQKWSHPMAAVVNTPPVAAANVSTATGIRDLVFAGDEHGNFVALDQHTGALVWQRNLGSVVTTCKLTPDGIYGITAAAAIDRSTNRIYEMGGTGRLYALNLGSGAVVAGWPVTVTSNPKHEHDWGALTLANGDVYVVIGGNCDRAPYHGRVVQVDTTSATIVGTFYTIPPTGPSGGAIWGWGGASVDTVAGAVYAASGNALTTPENFGYSEAVIRLTTGLALVAFDKPTLDAGVDLDFGSTPVLFQVAGCPSQLAVQNKDGELFLYDRDTIGSGPVQRIQVVPSTGLPFVGVPAWSDVNQRLYVSLTVDSTTYKHGMLALAETAPSCVLTKSWNTVNGKTGTNDSPPTVANGVVYIGNGRSNKLYAFNAVTGAVLWNSGTAMVGAAFSPPIVVNGMVFVGSYDHMLHAFGL